MFELGENMITKKEFERTEHQNTIYYILKTLGYFTIV